MGSSEPGFSTLLHPVVNGIEPHQSDNNEIDRDDKVQKSRHDQNEDAGDKGDTGCPAALISVFFEKLPPCLVGIEGCASLVARVNGPSGARSSCTQLTKLPV
jgi:hypothetical protein